MGQFCLYTALGSRDLGGNTRSHRLLPRKQPELIHQEIKKISVLLIIACLVLTAVYIWKIQKKEQAKND